MRYSPSVNDISTTFNIIAQLFQLDNLPLRGRAPYIPTHKCEGFTVRFGNLFINQRNNLGII